MNTLFRERLLVGAFVASLVVNITFLVVIGNSDIFQHADVINDLRAQQIRVYKPPIPQKPKPKIKKPPPPHKPPKQVIKPPTPHQVVIHKPVVKPPPQKVAVVSTGHHSTQGTVAVPQSSGDVGTPSTSITQPTPQPQPAPQPPPQPAPAPQPTPQPEPKPQPPPPAPKPAPPAIPDRPTPEIIGSWSDLQLPSDVDISTLSTSSIDVEWDVDTKGRTRNIKFESTGNEEVDEAIRRFIQDHHFEPAVQGGEPQEAHMEHTFTLG